MNLYGGVVMVLREGRSFFFERGERVPIAGLIRATSLDQALDTMRIALGVEKVMPIDVGRI